MSTKIMLEVARHSTAKGNAKLVLLLLASYAHPDGTHAEMSLSTIAREAGLSRRQVNTIVHFLAETGHVLLESAAGAHGTNRYAVQRLWLKQGNHFPGATTSPGEIAAPLGQPLPTIDKENKDLKTQLDEAIALGQPLPQDKGQSLPQDTKAETPVHVNPDAVHLVSTWGLGSNFFQVLQGKDPDPTRTPAEAIEIPAEPSRRTPKARYDTAKFYEGAPCDVADRLSHLYQETGKSLRYLKDDMCYRCVQQQKQQAQAAKARVIDLAAHRQAQGG